ncbi:MAG: beta (1-6) glucans synthase [Pseudomonadota bacterium]
MKRLALVYALVLLVIGSVWAALGRPRTVEPPGMAAGKKLQCVSYTPFRDGQSPYDFDRGLRIPATSVDQDLKLLAKTFDCVRTYSVTGLEAVPAAAERLGLSVLLGAWVSADPVATQKELLGVIALAKRHPSVVRAVIVGNEALLRKEVTGEQLAGYIGQVKRALPGVPVTYADVWEFWLKHPQVAPATDFVTIHILPYWEDEPAAIDDALAHVRKVYRKIARKIPGKDILIGETGWPSAGRMREGALPGIENQARFIRGFVQLAEQEHWQYNLIEAFDQPWKRVNEGTVGGEWGLFDTHRADKGVLAGPVHPHPQGWMFGLASAVLALATWPLLARRRSAGVGRLVTLVVAIASGAVLLGLQLEQFTITADSGLAWAYAGVLLLLASACYGLTIQALAGGPRAAPAPLSAVFRASPGATGQARLGGLIHAGLLLCLLGETAGLVFDSRYRDFNYFAFALPALAYLRVFTHRPDALPAPAIERPLAWALIGAAGFILYNETLHNLQAVAWALLCVLVACSLWRNAKGSPAPRLAALLLAAVSAYAVAAAVRYGLMEAPQFVGRCAGQAGDMLCALRGTLGLLIHFGVFGWLGLLTAIAAVATGNTALRIAATVLATVGLVLYNASLGIVAFAVVMIAIARDPE